MNNPTAPSDKGLLEEIKERASPILSCFGLSEVNDVNDEIYCAAIRIAVRNHEAAYPKDVARLILRHLIGQLPKRLVELFETFVPDGNLDATDDQLTKFRREINRYESLLGEDGSRESFYDEVRVKLGCVGLTASDPKILEAGWELTIHDTDSYYQREWTPDDIARHIIQREYGSRLVMDDENLYEFLSDDMEVFLETAECLRRRGLAASPTDICYAHNYGTVFYADKYLMERSKGVPEDICQWLILERKTWKQSDWNPEDELAAQGLLDLSVDVKSGVASLLDLSEDGSLGLDDVSHTVIIGLVHMTIHLQQLTAASILPSLRRLALLPLLLPLPPLRKHPLLPLPPLRNPLLPLPPLRKHPLLSLPPLRKYLLSLPPLLSVHRQRATVERRPRQLRVSAIIGQLS